MRIPQHSNIITTKLAEAYERMISGKARFRVMLTIPK